MTAWPPGGAIRPADSERQSEPSRQGEVTSAAPAGTPPTAEPAREARQAAATRQQAAQAQQQISEAQQQTAQIRQQVAQAQQQTSEAQQQAAQT
ncbi:MAG: hypothetical protein SVU24_03905, partial [Pseudomonadota bacterium]|nr:hypothetical protein [Pseudomonadota bacterium]